MNPKFLIYPFMVVTTLLLNISCRDNTKLIKTQQAQKAEILELEIQLSAANKILNIIPPDLTTEIFENKEIHKKLENDIRDRQAELDRLTVKESLLSQDMESYMSKYQIK